MYKRQIELMCLCGTKHWRRKIWEKEMLNKTFKQITIYCEKCQKTLKVERIIVLTQEPRRVIGIW